MQQLTDILNRKGFSNFEIITSPLAENIIPHFWNDVINATQASEKREILKKQWQSFADNMPRTLSLIANNIEDAVVIKTNHQYSLVYIFDIDGDKLAWVGYPPAASGPFLEYLPGDIAAFYTKLHNGWYEQVSGGLGFLALEQIEWLDVHEWGILDEIPPLDFELSKAFYIFHNAGPGYLCINVTDSNHPEYLIFWTNQPPKRNINFWAYMDAWIEIGLTN